MTVARAAHRGDRVVPWLRVCSNLVRSAPPLIVLSATLAAGCGPSALEGGFDSANPAGRMYAIEQAAREGDDSAIGDLIQLLDSDDPAVRYLAITTLERLTGQTHGYRHYDPQPLRYEAVQRWIAAHESGSLTAPATAPTPARSSAADNDHV